MTLHVYAQSENHDDAFIIGTRLELVKLRDSITAALDNKAAGRSSDSLSDHCTADGEEYDLIVKVIPESVMWKLELPYAQRAEDETNNRFCPFTVPTE